MHRLKIISGHLSPATSSDHRRDLWRSECGSRSGSAESSGPDDVVVVHGLRTAIGRAKRGSFKDTTPDELLSAVMTAVLTDVGLSPAELGDVCVGNVLQPGAGALMARVAHFLRSEVRGQTDPQSFTHSSDAVENLKIIQIISIRSECMDLGLACGITSENVAERFGVSREKQDAFALRSQQKAARAQASGLFDQEIVPVITKLVDDGGKEREVTVRRDDGVRPGTTVRSLSSVCLSRCYCCCFLSGLTVADIDVFEINEAFASQAVYCVEKLGIPLEKVNPNGGAIALGHPLGCTGARQVVTLLNELKRRGRKAYGVVSMCIGTGMGAAAVFEYPGP
uniref:Acetyl-CoA acyltransferase 1 n=1 Tax=Seriola lalandi dorsalis TaxID=1841481 RepID=A0A3B4WX95_SERLL